MMYNPAMPNEDEKAYPLRLPIEMYERLERAAKDADRSVNKQIVNWLREKLDEYEKGKKNAPKK